MTEQQTRQTPKRCIDWKLINERSDSAMSSTAAVIRHSVRTGDGETKTKKGGRVLVIHKSLFSRLMIMLLPP